MLGSDITMGLSWRWNTVGQSVIHVGILCSGVQSNRNIFRNILFPTILSSKYLRKKLQKNLRLKNLHKNLRCEKSSQKIPTEKSSQKIYRKIHTKIYNQKSSQKSTLGKIFTKNPNRKSQHKNLHENPKQRYCYVP